MSVIVFLQMTDGSGIAGRVRKDNKVSSAKRPQPIGGYSHVIMMCDVINNVISGDDEAELDAAGEGL